MPTLLLVHHTVAPSLQEAMESVQKGSDSAARELGRSADFQLVTRPALSASAVDLLAADAIILGTPANIGYMSGALKHFFDQVYYPTLTANVGLPWGLYVHGNDDCAGAIVGVERIVSGLQWRNVIDPVVLTGPITKTDNEALVNLGETVAAAALGLST